MQNLTVERLEKEQKISFQCSISLFMNKATWEEHTPTNMHAATKKHKNQLQEIKPQTPVLLAQPVLQLGRKCPLNFHY